MKNQPTPLRILVGSMIVLFFIILLSQFIFVLKGFGNVYAAMGMAQRQGGFWGKMKNALSGFGRKAFGFPAQPESVECK
ncbi:MAG: hypothetical protein V3U57_04400 [Robiginitomaculum sp.]